MTVLAGAGAGAVAVVHAAPVLLLVVGGPLALRHPRVLLVHVPVTIAIAGVFLAGADCPLTALEQALRGREFEGGFLGHYVLAPLGLDRSAASTQVLLLLAALVPNGVAAGVALRRRVKSATGSRNSQQR